MLPSGHVCFTEVTFSSFILRLDLQQKSPPHHRHSLPGRRETPQTSGKWRSSPERPSSHCDAPLPASGTWGRYLCVPSTSTAPSCGFCRCPVNSCCHVARAWGCAANAPSHPQNWDLPLLAQGSPKHVSEVSWACGHRQQGKGGCPGLLWLSYLWSKSRIQKLQLDGCPLPQEHLTCFCPQVSAFGPTSMSDATAGRTSTPENPPPSQGLETTSFHFGQKIHFYRLLGLFKRGRWKYYKTRLICFFFWEEELEMYGEPMQLFHIL